MKNQKARFTSKKSYILALTFIFIAVFSTTVLADSGVNLDGLKTTLIDILKGIGWVVGILGVIFFVKGLVSDQAESKVTAGLLFVGGLLLINAQALLTAIGFN